MAFWRKMSLRSFSSTRPEPISDKKHPPPSLSSPSTEPAKVVHVVDGTLEEFKGPVKAWQATVGKPNCFLCDSEAIFLGSPPPVIADEEEIRKGKLYFCLSDSVAKRPVSLADLCRLAVTAVDAMSSSISDSGSKSRSRNAISVAGEATNFYRRRRVKRTVSAFVKV